MTRRLLHSSDEDRLCGAMASSATVRLLSEHVLMLATSTALIQKLLLAGGAEGRVDLLCVVRRSVLVFELAFLRIFAIFHE